MNPARRDFPTAASALAAWRYAYAQANPYLVSTMGVAFTRGMQGADVRAGVFVCAKR